MRSAPMRVQVFGDNPTAWRRREEPPPELAAFRERLDALGHRAGRDPRLLPRQPRRRRRRTSASVRSCCSPRSCGGARVPGAVRQRPHRLAPGHRGGRRRRPTRRRRSRGCSRDVDDGPDSAQLVLENSAGGGFGLGDDGRRSSRTSPRPSPPAVSRTAASGSASTRRMPGAPAPTFRRRMASTRSSRSSTRRIGIERVVMVHLNDSKSERGSRLDRHEHIGAGRIGGAGLAPC